MPNTAKPVLWRDVTPADRLEYQQTIDVPALVANLAKAEPEWDDLPRERQLAALRIVVEALTDFHWDHLHEENWPRRADARARIETLQNALSAAITALKGLDPRAAAMVEAAAVQGPDLPDFIDDEFLGPSELIILSAWGICAAAAWAKLAMEAVPEDQERRSDGRKFKRFVHRIITAYAVIRQGKPVRAGSRNRTGLVAFIAAALRTTDDVSYHERTIENVASAALAERKRRPAPGMIKKRPEPILEGSDSILGQASTVADKWKSFQGSKKV